MNEVIVNDMMKPHTRQVHQSLNGHEIHPFASFVSMVKFQLLFGQNNIVFPSLITKNSKKSGKKIAWESKRQTLFMNLQNYGRPLVLLDFDGTCQSLASVEI